MKCVMVTCQIGVLFIFLIDEVVMTEAEQDIKKEISKPSDKSLNPFYLKAAQRNASHVAANSTVAIIDSTRNEQNVSQITDNSPKMG